MRDEPDDDELVDAVLLELQIEVRVGEAARAPVLRSDDLARPGLEPGADLAAPRAVFEGLAPPCRLLNGSDVLPGLVVARPVAMVQGIEYPKLRLPCRIEDLQHVRNAIVRFGDRANAVPELAALGNEVVVGIDYQEPGDLLVVCGCGHGVASRGSSGNPIATASPACAGVGLDVRIPHRRGSRSGGR